MIAGQNAEIAVLREQLAVPQPQVADLAAPAKSNSRNSSKPPPDGLAKPAPPEPESQHTASCSEARTQVATLPDPR